VERTPAYRTIRELADDERPRERLLRFGPQVLSDAELVALILRAGTPGENVLDLARRLLDRVGGLAGLVRADPQVLAGERGIGPAKAAVVAAAVELGRRAGRLVPEERPQLLSPEAVFGYVGSYFLGRTREELLVLALDSRGRLLGAPHAIPGNVNAVSLRPAEVFRPAVIAEAVSIIVVHNHPSGDPTPSSDDVRVTEELRAAGRLLDIELLDHVVIGQNRFVSMHRERLGFP